MIFAKDVEVRAASVAPAQAECLINYLVVPCAESLASPPYVISWRRAELGLWIASERNSSSLLP